MKKQKKPKQSSQILHSFNELDKILSGTDEPIFILNAKDYSVAALNSSAKKFLAQHKSSLFSDNFVDTFPTVTNRLTKSNTTFKELLWHHIKSKRKRVFFIQPQQSKKTFEISFNAIKLSNQEHFIFIKMRDVTYQTSNKAESIRFIRTIGHELKQPLSLIKAYTYYIKTKLLLKNSTAAAEYPEKIDQQVDILTAMLNDIVDSTKLSTQRIELDKQKIELVSWTNIVLADLQSRYPTRKFVFESSSPINYSGDSIRLRQAIYNLCINAIKYSPSESIVTISLNKTKKNIIITISDLGIGIPKHELGKIFQPYFRSIRSKATGAKGLGLGLTLVKEIIVAHGGKIKVSSEINSGSSFIITLPLT